MASHIPCLENTLDLQCTACSALITLDQKIAELQAQRLTVLSEINQIHDPFNCLPIEICAEILQQCRPSTDITEKIQQRDNVRRAFSVPLLLSQVCRRWRAVCHSSPNLWTAIPLFAGGFQGPVSEVVSTWVGRSGGFLPWSIVLMIQSPGDLTRTHCRSVFDFIATHAHRIHELQAYLSRPVLRELCAVYRDRANLKILRLSCAKIYSDDNVAIQWTGASKFRPTSLRIDDASSIILSVVDTSVLTHLEVDGLLASECLFLLMQSPILVTCTLTRIRFHGSVLQQSLVHSRLQCLSVVHFVQSNTTSSILEALNLPLLDTITLSLGSSYDQIVAIDAVIRLLRQSGSSLRALSLFNISLETSNHCSFLGKLVDVVAPSLNELDLSAAADRTGVSAPSDKKYFPLFFQSLVPRLLRLRSIVLFSPKSDWLHMLWKSLTACFSIVSTTGQELSVMFWSDECPLDTAGNVSADATYDFHDNPVPLKATAVLDMIGIMQHPLITLKVKYSSAGSIGDRQPETDIDISVEIMAALGSLAQEAIAECLPEPQLPLRAIIEDQ